MGTLLEQLQGWKSAIDQKTPPDYKSVNLSQLLKDSNEAILELAERYAPYFTGPENILWNKIAKRDQKFRTVNLFAGLALLPEFKETMIIAHPNLRTPARPEGAPRFQGFEDAITDVCTEGASQQKTKTKYNITNPSFTQNSNETWYYLVMHMTLLNNIYTQFNLYQQTGYHDSSMISSAIDGWFIFHETTPLPPLPDKQHVSPENSRYFYDMTDDRLNELSPAQLATVFSLEIQVDKPFPEQAPLLQRLVTLGLVAKIVNFLNVKKNTENMEKIQGQTDKNENRDFFTTKLKCLKAFDEQYNPKTDSVVIEPALLPEKMDSKNDNKLIPPTPRNSLISEEEQQIITKNEETRALNNLGLYPADSTPDNQLTMKTNTPLSLDESHALKTIACNDDQINTCLKGTQWTDLNKNQQNAINQLYDYKLVQLKRIGDCTDEVTNSLTNFYIKAVSIIKDNPENLVNAKIQLKDEAKNQFSATHRHTRFERLLADAFMMITFLFGGASIGLYRLSKGRSFFASSAHTPTQREIELEKELKQMTYTEAVLP